MSGKDFEQKTRLKSKPQHLNNQSKNSFVLYYVFYYDQEPNKIRKEKMKQQIRLGTGVHINFLNFISWDQEFIKNSLKYNQIIESQVDEIRSKIQRTGQKMMTLKQRREIFVQNAFAIYNGNKYIMESKSEIDRTIDLHLIQVQQKKTKEFINQIYVWKTRFLISKNYFYQSNLLKFKLETPSNKYTQKKSVKHHHNHQICLLSQQSINKNANSSDQYANPIISKDQYANPIISKVHDESISEISPHQNEKPKKARQSIQSSKSISSNRSILRNQNQQSSEGQPIQRDLMSKDNMNAKNVDIEKKNENIYSQSGRWIKVNRGLLNIGLTCYMNSGLQCLIICSLLSEDFLNENDGKWKEISQQQTPLAAAYQQFLKQMFTTNKNVLKYRRNPFDSQKLKDRISIYNSRFCGIERQDCHQFLLTLLDSLHDQLKIVDQRYRKGGKNINFPLGQREWGRRGNSPISNQIAGQFITTIQCLQCQEKKRKRFIEVVDCYLIFPLPIFAGNSRMRQGRINLNSCFDLFCGGQELQGENKWWCEFCEQECVSLKQMNIYKTGKYLIILLKRFDEYRKINREVIIPIDELDLSKFVKNSQDREEGQNKKYVFRLIGAVNHYGSLQAGHYTAYTRNRENKNWCYYSDELVTQDVELKQSDLRNAYILFYERK